MEAYKSPIESKMTVELVDLYILLKKFMKQLKE